MCRHVFLEQKSRARARLSASDEEEEDDEYDGRHSSTGMEKTMSIASSSKEVLC